MPGAARHRVDYGDGRAGERVGPWRPRRRNPRRQPPSRRLGQNGRQRDAADRRVLPQEDRLCRRIAEDRQRHVLRRPVRRQRAQRTSARTQRFGRGPEDAPPIEVQLADRAVHDLLLSGAGAQEDRARRHSRQPPRELRALLASPFTSADAIGDHDHRSAGGARDVGRTRQLRREVFDRRGLRDVERFAGGDRPRLVDEPNRARDVAPREHVCCGAAELTRAEDGHFPHAVDYCKSAMHTLKGKVAIVTGGSRGIGLAIARGLVGDAVNVTVTGRSDAHLSAARPRIEAAGPGAVETLQADVRRFDDMRRVMDATVARFGGLDILINNAGVGFFAGVASMSPEQWSEVIDTNLTGVFYATHAALPHMQRRGGGFIINISSLAGKNPFADGAAYCASKAGLNAFSEALMQEVRYDNIRVSYVLPGSVATAFSSGDESKGADWKIAPDEVADVVLNLLRHNPRSLPSRVELRPSKPRKS